MITRDYTTTNIRNDTLRDYTISNRYTSSTPNDFHHPPLLSNPRTNTLSDHNQSQIYARTEPEKYALRFKGEYQKPQIDQDIQPIMPSPAIKLEEFNSVMTGPNPQRRTFK
jgi:hypothetical protein